jgi:hypothetical protein
MTNFDEIARRNLEENWGAAASHSEYTIGSRLRYRADGSTWRGEIVWIAAQSESSVQGRDPLPMRYIVERDGWEGSIPDVVYSSDILECEAQEPSLERCRFCLGLHPLGTSKYCPLNPNRERQKE